MDVLRDDFGRSFSYLRLSLIDACNFRCKYCLPNGYRRSALADRPGFDSPLTLSEITRLMEAFASMGFRKLRLTGGEPTLRNDILEIVRATVAIPGIETVGLTTNGYRLDQLAKPLFEAGLRSINISLDSLNADHFQNITGSKRFGHVQRGLEQVLALGYLSVKINVVMLREFLSGDLDEFFQLVRNTAVSVRFIELMETGGNHEFFQAQHYPATLLEDALARRGWREVPRGELDGPAREFYHPDYLGRFGIIAPYSKDFCRSCNRLRISSRGALKLCLFGDGEYSLRELLQSPHTQSELVHRVSALLGLKSASHRLHERDFGSTEYLASIGG